MASSVISGASSKLRPSLVNSPGRTPLPMPKSNRPREIVERGRLGGEPQRVMEGKDVDVVAQAHPRGALERGRDHQIGARQQRVVREVMLGEPALAEAERLGQRDLVQHLRVRLIVRHAAPLAVVEEPEVHRQDTRALTGSGRSR